MGCCGSKAKPVEIPQAPKPEPKPVVVPPPAPPKPEPPKEPEIHWADPNQVEHVPVVVIEKTQPSQYNSHPQGKLPLVDPTKESCDSYVCYGIDMNEEIAKQDKYLMPLKTVKVSTELRGAIVSSNVELVYINTDPNRVLDCFFSYKVEEKSFITDFEAKVQTSDNKMPF